MWFRENGLTNLKPKPSKTIIPKHSLWDMNPKRNLRKPNSTWTKINDPWPISTEIKIKESSNLKLSKEPRNKIWIRYILVYLESCFWNIPVQKGCQRTYKSVLPNQEFFNNVRLSKKNPELQKILSLWQQENWRTRENKANPQRKAQ